jgi:hypothetical protein
MQQPNHQPPLLLTDSVCIDLENLSSALVQIIFSLLIGCQEHNLYYFRTDA